MGCDIHGVFEAHRPDHDKWRYLGRLWPHVGRPYDTFGSLFGVRNMAQFEPLFPKRGLPNGRGWKFDQIIKEYEDPEYHDGSLIGTVSFHSPTWVMLSELMDVDWSEEADDPDSRFSVLNENKEPTGSKSAWSSGHTQLYEQHQEELAAGEAVPFETSDGEQRYLQRRVLTRLEALSSAWEWVIFDLMPLYGERYGEENIRLTVWFDN